MKTALITGSAGLIGSESARYFAQQGLNIAGIDNNMRQEFFGKEASTLPNRDDLKTALGKLYKHYDVDIRGDTSAIFAEYSSDIDVVIHTAAQPSHDWAARDPVTDFDVNARATLLLLENTRKYCPKATFIFTSCHDADTRLVTKDGFKYYWEIKPTDTIFTLNLQTRKAEEKSINEIKIFDYNGEMVEFKGKRLSFCVTPNHKMCIVEKNQNLNCRVVFVESEQFLATKDYKVFNIPKATSYQGKVFPDTWTFGESTKKDIKQIKTQDLFYLLGLFIADGSAYKGEKQLRTRSGLDRKSYLEKGRNKSGQFTTTHCGERVTDISSYNVWFYVPTKDKARKNLEEILERNNVNYKKYSVPNDTVYIHSRNLYNFFKQCGRYANKKTIPFWALCADSALLQFLFDGLMDGDGNKTHNSYTTVSPRLAENLIELSIKLGKNVSYKKTPSPPPVLYKKLNRKIVARFPVYRINVTDTLVGFSSKNTKKCLYQGKVWCLDVENHNFLVERKGKIAFSGNSNKVYGDNPNRLPLQELPTRYEISNTHPYYKNGIDESMSVDNCKHSLFGCSKLAADVLVQEYARYFGINTGVFRCGCLTGPWHAGTQLHGFLQYLMKCTKEGKPYTVFGHNGKQVRDNLLSYDLARAFWQFYLAPRIGEVYNMGGGRFANCSMLEAIEMCETITGKKLEWQYSQDARAGDHIWWISDVSKFQKHFPKWFYTSGIHDTLVDIYNGR